jgi:purine-cytosine permease-like protein
MRRFNRFMKTMKKRWQEAGMMVGILIFAAIMTVFRPFDPDSVSYFSDVTTPLILIVAVLLIIVGVRSRSQVV